MVSLASITTAEGAETRVLLAECRGPSYSGFSLSVAQECMQLMDVVLWNRVKLRGYPDTLIKVIKQKGQFQGFESYPNYDSGIRANIQSMINIANAQHDPRSSAFADFINAAKQIASAATIADPADPRHLTAWRTAGSGSPGGAFQSYKTVSGTTFFSQP
jgi:hypothetical protein